MDHEEAMAPVVRLRSGTEPGEPRGADVSGGVERVELFGYGQTDDLLEVLGVIGG